MSIVRIRSYNAIAAKKAGKSLTLTDRIIMMRSRLTHTEIQFSYRYSGMSFSFTLADKANGARFKKIEYSHSERWNTTTWQVTYEEEDLMFAKACAFAGIDVGYFFFIIANYPKKNAIIKGENHWKYDTAGLLTFALQDSGKLWLNVIRSVFWCWTLPIRPHRLKAWCSEGVCSLIKLVEPTFWLEPEKTSPEILDREFRLYLADKTGRTL